MKNLLIAVFVGLMAVQISAQDKYGNRFYADLVGKAATLNSDWGLFGGMRAGYHINENISLGLIGLGLIPDKIGSSYINKDNRDELHFGYGGAEVSYKYALSDKFSLTGMLMIGAGRTDYDKLGGYDYFFITEPGASLNYNITEWFGLGYSVGYRFASGVNYADLSDASFGGWSSSLDFKFNFNVY